jgi:3-oxoacyl-[acyl-carrier protein] reductase
MLSMIADLGGQLALVTGAGRGIGRGIALALAGCGAHALLAARTESQLREVEREIRAKGGQASVLPTDLAQEGQITALFQAIAREHGRLDVLVNNAGLGLFGALAEFSAQDFDRLIAVNLKAVFLCAREAMRLMIPRRRGYIINISSVVGFKGYPNQSIYTATKHGVMGITKSLAVEAQGHGIRVSAVLPGGVDTQLVGDARPDLDREALMQPEDIAQTVLFLLSLSERAAIDQIYIRRRTSAPF